MVESYRVQAALQINSNAGQVLAAAGRAMGTLDGRIRAMERNLNAVMRRFDGFGDAARAANDLARGMDGLSRATERAAEATGRSARSTERASRAGRERAAAMESESRALVRYGDAMERAARSQSMMGTVPRMLTYSGGGGALVPAPRLLSYDGRRAANDDASAPIGGPGGTRSYAGRGSGAWYAGGAGLAALALRSGGAGGPPPPPVQALLGSPGGGGGFHNLGAAWLAGRAGAGGGGGGAIPPGGSGAGGAGGAGGGSGGLVAAAAYGTLGYSLLHFAGAAIEAGGELQHQQTMLRAAGLDARTVADATARAWETTRLARGTNVTANLDLFAGLRGAFTDAQSRQFLPDFARFNMALGTSLGRDPGKSGAYAARFLSLRNSFQDPATGNIVPERGLNELAMLQRTIIGTAGRIGPQDFLNFQKQAGISGTRMSPEALFQFMPSLIESMGGHRAGTALAAASRQIVSGTMTQRVADEMMRFGLIDRSAVDVRRGGQVVVRPGGVQGSRDFAADPFKWVENVLRPALLRGGATTQDQQLEAVARLFGTETARRFISELLVSAPEIRQNAAMIAGVRADAGSVLAGTDGGEGSFRTAIAAVKAGWQNLMTALGYSPQAIGALNMVADGLNGLAGWARENPAMATAIIEMVAALGALAVGVAVFAAGGAVATALGALAGPVGLLALVGGGVLLLWNSLDGKDWSEKLSSLARSLETFWDFLKRSFGFGPSAAPGAAPPSTNLPGLTGPGFSDPSGSGFILQNFQPTPPRAAPAVTPASMGAWGGTDAATSRETVIRVPVMLDGRQIYEAVARHQERDLSRPARSGAGFDTRMALPGVEQV